MTGTDDKSRRGHRAGLSEDEAALWRYVTRGVTPKRGKARVPAHAAETETNPASRRPLPEAPAAPSPRTAVPKPRPPATPARAPEDVRPMPLERRKARRIAKGGQEIEARLDLHGLTQEEAHRALEHFILRASRDGRRTVLVITGKGAPSRTDAFDDGGFRARERGVLRRMVPHWLDGPTLRPLVISYTQAHVRHGGEGALYVMLRRT